MKYIIGIVLFMLLVLLTTTSIHKSYERGYDKGYMDGKQESDSIIFICDIQNQQLIELQKIIGQYEVIDEQRKVIDSLLIKKSLIFLRDAIGELK